MRDFGIFSKRRWVWLLPFIFIVVGFIFRKQLFAVPIPVCQSIIALFVGYLGVHMAVHPLQKEETMKKWVYKILFVILSACIISLTWVQYHQDQKEKTTSQNDFNTKLSDLNKHFDNQIGDIKTNQGLAMQSIEKIVEEQARSQSNPQLLSKIADAKEVLQRNDREIGNLEAWISQFKTREEILSLHKEQAQMEEWRKVFPHQREILEQMQPIWSEIMVRVEENAAIVGRDYYGSHSIASNDFLFATNLLSFFSTNHPSADLINIVVANMKIATNETWECTCSIRAGSVMDDQRPAEFNVQCNNPRNIALQFCKRDKSLEASLSISGERVNDWQFPIADYRTNIIPAINDFFAAQGDQFTNHTSKSKP